MITRAAPLLIALALPGAPAFAQDTAESAPSAVPLPPLPEAAAVEPAGDPAAAPEPAAAEARPAPAAPPAPPTPSPFAPDQRAGWLAQCRVTFLRAGAGLGGGNGLPDACETQLVDFERSYVPCGDGQPPVIWVRVPVTRVPAALPAPDPADADAEAPEAAEE